MNEEDGEPEVYQFPEFFDRLKTKGVMRTRDVVESTFDDDGLVYHHRGLQLPAQSVTFALEDASTFAVHVDGLGARSVAARFDLDYGWDIYLVIDSDRPVVAWMTDAEYEAEEADAFPSKTAAILAGRFSFGTFFLHGSAWEGRRMWADGSTAPAILQLGDGRILDPVTEADFVAATAAIPPEFRQDDPTPPPDHLGLLSVTLEADYASSS